MPRVLPSRRRVRSLLGLLLEMALITGAVFLGLLADEWRENRQQQRLADTALERFRAEVETNKLAIEAVRETHQALLDRVAAFLQADSQKTLLAFATQVRFAGIRAPSFDRTALDLAIGTGSLGYIDSDLVYAISRTYTAQTRLERLQDGFREAMLGPTTFATPDTTGVAIALQAYLADIVIQEPQLIERYTTLAAELDAALGATRSAE